MLLGKHWRRENTDILDNDTPLDRNCCYSITLSMAVFIDAFNERV